MGFNVFVLMGDFLFADSMKPESISPKAETAPHKVPAKKHLSTSTMPYMHPPFTLVFMEGALHAIPRHIRARGSLSHRGP